MKKWAQGEGVSATSDAELVKHPKVVALIQSEIDKHSTEWKGFERVKKVTLAEEDFTTANGMLTPSLKLKRRIAWQRYKEQIEALYEEDAKAKGASVAV